MKKLTCPECGHSFTEDELEPHQFVGEPEWLNCPHCEIGQSRKNWEMLDEEATEKGER